MSEIRMQIDGKEVGAEEGMTVLEAARAAGICNLEAIFIPTGTSGAAPFSAQD